MVTCVNISSMATDGAGIPSHTSARIMPDLMVSEAILMSFVTVTSIQISLPSESLARPESQTHDPTLVAFMTFPCVSGRQIASPMIRF